MNHSVFDANANSARGQALCQDQVLLVPVSPEPKSEATGPPPLIDEPQEDYVTHGCSRSEITELVDSLPRNLHLDKAANASENDTQRLPLEILEEDETEDAEEKNEAGLTIAWQYRKSVQSARMGKTGSTKATSSSGDVYCHSFDLSGRLKDQDVSRTNTVQLVDCDCYCGSARCKSIRSCGIASFRQLVACLSTATANNTAVVRLFLHRVRPATMKVALPLLLAHIREKKLPVVVLVTVEPWNSCISDMLALRRTTDVVLKTEAFASRASYPPPAEFQHLTGLLHIPKVSTVTLATANGGGNFADMTTSKRPPSHVFGLKRDRRKLHIPLLHIPPEDYAGGDGSVQGGGVRSGAGRGPTTDTKKKQQSKSTGCGSSGSNSLLDF